MYLMNQKYVISHIYNGPHTIVSTMPNGYSVTVRDIIISDDEKREEMQ